MVRSESLDNVKIYLENSRTSTDAEDGEGNDEIVTAYLFQKKRKKSENGSITELCK